MVLPEVVRKFCETTTIRGIGRAVKSESKFLFVVWWISVMCCTMLMAYQMYLVLSRYYRYDHQIVDRDSNDRPVSTFLPFTDCYMMKIINALFKQSLIVFFVSDSLLIEGNSSSNCVCKCLSLANMSITCQSHCMMRLTVLIPIAILQTNRVPTDWREY
jgi:Amiloride-sensitive sodium channel